MEARNGGDATDVDSRIEAAGMAFGALRGCIFSSTHVNSQAKKTVYTILILTVLLYGSETWCSTGCAASTRAACAVCAASRASTAGITTSSRRSSSDG
eukprot:2166355-Prymnesium_polylepis.1